MSIEETLIKARDQYYNEGQSFLSDSEYDILEEQLKKSDPTNPFFIGIGSDVRTDKVKLPYSMGSLTQIYDNDYKKWISSNNLQKSDVVISSKMDGVSVLLIYSNNGSLQICYSRGNGIEGQDITRHIKNIKNIPHTVDAKAAIRAECIISKTNFQKFLNECQDKNYKTYKNPRNAVAGLLNSKSVPSWIYKYLEIIAFELIGDYSKHIQFELLNSYGFDTVWYSKYIASSLSDIQLKQFIDYTKNSGPLSDYEQDGIVIDIDNHLERIKLKSTDLNPEYARKFKVRDDTNIAQVIVKKVHWDPSKNSLLKPRIEIEPIDINGVTITFTHGFNAKYIVDNSIGPGSILLLTRSGDVIPYIISVIKSQGSPDVPDFNEFGHYEWNKTKVDFILTSSNDIVKMKGVLSFFVSLDIPSLKEGSVKKLIEEGYDSIPKILNMTREELELVIGKNGIKIFNGINERFDNLTQYDFMGSFPCFPSIGKRKFEKIYDSIGIFDIISKQQLLSCEGFDYISADIVLDNMSEYHEIVSKINRDIIFKDKVSYSGLLNGLVFVFTGYRDKSANAIIEQNGGEISNSINSKTDYLVTKDPSKQSSKTKKVQELNNKGSKIKIINPTELWTLLNKI